jgi:hypothetical protein
MSEQVVLVFGLLGFFALVLAIVAIYFRFRLQMRTKTPRIEGELQLDPSRGDDADNDDGAAA